MGKRRRQQSQKNKKAILGLIERCDSIIDKWASEPAAAMRELSTVTMYINTTQTGHSNMQSVGLSYA